MSIAVVTGSGGMIGSEAVRHFAAHGMDVIGIDNDMRAVFLGEEASTSRTSRELRQSLRQFTHLNMDIRDGNTMNSFFRRYRDDIALVIHAAAQPSHEWAARDPKMDFHVNAMGTLNLLEAVRSHCPEAVFIFTSTNEVYGDRPSRLPLIELDERWEVDPSHPAAQGIDEDMSIDHCLHSVTGASKVAADLLVQEYGRSFELRTACFRIGCLTAPHSSASNLQDPLASLVRSCVTETAYEVGGHGGKQVRDYIHSYDLLKAFDAFYRQPRSGEVYNMGGGRFSNCSVLEAVALTEDMCGLPVRRTSKDTNHAETSRWWVTNVARFRSHYPEWKLTYDVPAILRAAYEHNVADWAHAEMAVMA